MKDTALIILLAVAGLVAIGAVTYFLIRDRAAAPGIDDRRKDPKELRS